MQASDLKINTAFEIDGNIFVAIDIRHVQQPRLASFLSIKYKNIETGQVFEKRFNTGDKIGSVQIERKEMQYLYQDGSLYYFMDPETYEQMPLNEKDVKEALKYVVDGGMVTITTALERIIEVAPPMFVELEITDSEPGLAGNTATNVTKPATLETGFEIRVPLFVNTGDKIKVDTRTGTYVERV